MDLLKIYNTKVSSNVFWIVKSKRDTQLEWISNNLEGSFLSLKIYFGRCRETITKDGKAGSLWVEFEGGKIQNLGQGVRAQWFTNIVTQLRLKFEFY